MRSTQRFQSICGRYNAMGTVYPVYRLACNYVHPSARTAFQYLHADAADYSPDVFQRASDLPILERMIFWTAVCLVWATKDFTSLLVQHDFTEVLSQAEAELGVVSIEELPTSKSFGALDLSEDRLDSLLFREGSRV